jgi:hypothetical protein
MPLDLSYASGTAVSVTATEKSLSVTGGADLVGGVPFARTDAGIYRLWLDCRNLIAGDQYRWRVYEKTRSGGAAIIWDSALIFGPIAEGLLTIPYELGIGWDITLVRVSATSRAFDWHISRLR